jgi:hypothetical protein
MNTINQLQQINDEYARYLILKIESALPYAEESVRLNWDYKYWLISGNGYIQRVLIGRPHLPK